MLCLQAGRLLAQLLMQGGHGDRPVTLIGYSMGARLVFHCLLELARSNCKGAVFVEGYRAVSPSLSFDWRNPDDLAARCGFTHSEWVVTGVPTLPRPGVVENAVMLGAPVSTSLERWALARSSVSGRLINGYSTRDWILGLVYRGSNGARPLREVVVTCIGACCRASFISSDVLLCAQASSKQPAASRRWTAREWKT